MDRLEQDIATHQHILDALRTMEERGISPEWSDFEAIAELLEEMPDEPEEKQLTNGGNKK